MLDTMTATKVVAAFCGALLILLLGQWVAEELYHVGGGGHGDGEEHAMGYAIEVPETPVGGAEVEEVPFGELLLAADIGKGERVWGKCKACHKLEDGANGTGPHLYDLIGRAVGSVPGFDYSGALVAVAQEWSPENLDGFLENPKGWAPGTKMGFAGLRKAEDRANLIAYLETIGG